ncbi:hypothetical protein R6Q57_030016 [Mikania cordata]
MNEPKYAYPYPAHGGYYQGPPVMAPPQYYAAPPPRREAGFLEGCLEKSFKKKRDGSRFRAMKGQAARGLTDGQTWAMSTGGRGGGLEGPGGALVPPVFSLRKGDQEGEDSGDEASNQKTKGRPSNLRSSHSVLRFTITQYTLSILELPPSILVAKSSSRSNCSPLVAQCLRTLRAARVRRWVSRVVNSILLTT